MRIDRRRIEKEAEDHIALGLLLRKPRSPSRRQEVDRILRGQESVGRKVQSIRRLDAQPEDGSSEEGQREAAVPSEPGARVERPHPPRPKLEPAAAGYWAFVFRELPRLQAFGRRTRTLRISWLPPSVRADPGLKAFLIQSAQPWAAELGQRLKPVLELGWLHLSKRQYNGLALLARLAARIQAADFARLDWRDRSLIDSLRGLESDFLLLHSREGLPEELTGSLQRVFEKKSRLESDFRPAADLLRRLLSPEGSLPSLYHSLLALNAVKYRRLLGLEELTRGGLGEVVSSVEFDCPPEIRARIEEYVAGSVENLQALHVQLTELRRLSAYLNLDADGQADTRLLAALYGAKMAADRDNLMVLAPRLFTVFERTFQPLLAGSVAVEGAPPAAVFEPSFFQNELTRLVMATERLEKAAFGFANFPFRRYLAIRSSNLGAIAKELEVLRLVEEGLAVLFELGRTLARVLALDGVGAAGAEGSAAGEGQRALDASVLQGQPFTLPFGARRLQAEGFLRGLTVREALAQVIRICLSAGHLLQDPALFALFGKEPRLEAQLSATLRQLEHLVDAEAYAELKLRYA